jgi:chromosome segregation ATPase
MDEDFINQYVQRILREVDHINRDRLLKETKIIILESHNEVNKNEIENLKTQIAIADELKNQALSSLEKVTVDYKNLQENKNALESNIRDLHNEKNNLNQELNNEKNRAANLDREFARQSAELNSVFLEFKNLQENKNALESVIRDLNNEKIELNQELAKQSDEHNARLLELQNSTQQVVDTTVTTRKNIRRPRPKVLDDDTF